MKENKNFWRDIATCRELVGNDLRVVMLCHNRDVMQKDMLKETGWNKSNLSRIVNKLHKIGILERTEEYGVYFYRTNTSWINDQCAGQMHIKDL